MFPIIDNALGVAKEFFGWKRSANEAIEVKHRIRELRYSKKAIEEAQKIIWLIEEANCLDKNTKKKFVYRKKKFLGYIAKD